MTRLRFHDLNRGPASAGLNPEIRLFEEWNAETYNIYGVEVIWFPMEYQLNKDEIYGEDTLKKYASAGPLDIQLDIGMESDMWETYGITQQEMLKGRISLSAISGIEYSNTSGVALTGFTPTIGDLIKFVYNNLLYEIVDIGNQDRESSFTLNWYNYEFTLRRFYYSDETGIPADNQPASGSSITDTLPVSAEGDEIFDYDEDDDIDDSIFGEF